MRNKFYEIFKGTYLDKNTSSTVIFFSLVENALGSIIIGLLVSILIGIIFLILYYMFLSFGLGAVVDKIDYLFIIIVIFVIFVILSISTIGGASKGAQSLKEYSWSNLGIQIDELEELIEKLPHDRKVKIRDKIAKSINHILNNEIVDNLT